MRGGNIIQCKDCERVLPERKFVLEKGRKNRRTKCMRCRDAKARYGITGKEFFTMLENQLHCCLICENPINEKTAVVDHCHNNLSVRALLCSKCNTAIGFLDHEQDYAYRAFEYLKKFT